MDDSQALGAYNAGTATTLDRLTPGAQARANETQRSVGLYQHVGGRLGGKVVQPVGTFLWRDLVDENGKALGTPKLYRLVSTLDPEP